jgi:hypothetical protein
MLTRLNEAFDTLDPDSINEDVYYDLQEMRTQNRLLLQNLRTTLPYYVSLRTNLIPTAVLAYNLYGDSSRSDELNALNGVEDPCFISGNRIVHAQSVGRFTLGVTICDSRVRFSAVPYN